MIYSNITEGIFIKRINRFIAEVIVDDILETVHVKNTGRCKELFIEGRQCYLEKSNNPNRKTKYSLIGIYKENELINIDSQVPNQVVYEALSEGKILDERPTYIKREQTYGNSRFDVYYETPTKKGFIEVKGVTLEIDGVAKFPDAPTTRGTKHVNELVEGLREGYTNYIVLLIQMDHIKYFTPNYERDPIFGEALKKAVESGVLLKCFTSKVTETSIEILNEIPYKL
ncbi:MAG: DNA/RNA nuclease SfsA [Clostridia bacterium]|nr:DNA/RNA nuclease SfsA [Clostridia bacterium]